MSGTSENLISSIRQYYVAAERAYVGWGKDYERPGIYALHCGFHPDGIPIDQYESTKRMTKEIIARTDIKSGNKVLDAGCGSGAVLFELADSYPDTDVFGINVAQNQLETAALYAKNSGLERVNLSMQDYLQTGFVTSYFDRVIYSESLAHAEDKVALLRETRRILKNEGRVVIADAFLNHRNLDANETQLVNWAENGWVLPPLSTIKQMVEALHIAGFARVVIEDVTTNILPSTSRMALNASVRLDGHFDDNMKDQLTMSRYACMAADQLMRSGTLGYFFLVAHVH